MKSNSEPLSNRSQSRWKWMAGSTAAATAAVASSTTAETVQITQAGNFVTGASGSITADLTGDGLEDLMNVNTAREDLPETPGSTTTYSRFMRVWWNNGGIQTAFVKFENKIDPNVNGGQPFSTTYRVAFSTTNSHSTFGASPVSLDVLFPITFTDDRINGGATTAAFLDARLDSGSPSLEDLRIAFLRVVFDDESVAAPPNITAGGTDTEWVSPAKLASLAAESAAIIAESSRLNRKIKRLKKKAKKHKKSGNLSKALKLNGKVRKLKRQLNSL